MIDDRNLLSRCPAVVTREEIAFKTLNLCFNVDVVQPVLEATEITRGANKTADIGKSEFQKLLHDFGSDKATRSGDQDSLVPRYNVVGIQHWVKGMLLNHFNRRSFPGL